MPSGIKEDIIQAARRWVISVMELDESTGRAKVIPPSRSDDLVQSVAPTPPYAVVDLPSFGRETGTYETYYKVIPAQVGPPAVPETYRIIRRIPKQATLRVICVGADAEDWPTRLAMFRDAFDDNVGVLARVLSVNDATVEDENGQYQRRHVIDLLLEYRVEVDGPTLTPAQTVGLTIVP